MRKVEGNVGVIGWGTMPDDNEFLEMRVAAGGEVVPSGLDSAIPVCRLRLVLPCVDCLACSVAWALWLMVVCGLYYVPGL